MPGAPFDTVLSLLSLLSLQVSTENRKLTRSAGLRMCDTLVERASTRCLDLCRVLVSLSQACLVTLSECSAAFWILLIALEADLRALDMWSLSAGAALLGVSAKLSRARALCSACREEPTVDTSSAAIPHMVRHVWAGSGCLPSPAWRRLSTCSISRNRSMAPCPSEAHI